MITVAVLVAIVAAVGEISVAADVGQNTGAFLRIGIGARAAGLGGAFSAAGTGAAANYWNPAGLAYAERSEVMFSHFSWYQDITVEHGSAVKMLTDKVALGAGLTYLNYGTIEGFDINGQSTGELSAYDLAASLSAAYRVSDDIALGITGRHIRMQLDSYVGSAWAADLGVTYTMPAVKLAAVLSNIGTGVKFDTEQERLPASARVGLMAHPFVDELMAAVEFEKEFDGSFSVKQGLEFGFQERYFVRAGYNRTLGDLGGSFISDMSLGLGLVLDFAKFDYAFTPQDGALSEDLHRFTATFGFGR